MRIEMCIYCNNSIDFRLFPILLDTVRLSSYTTPFTTSDRRFLLFAVSACLGISFSFL